MTLAEIIAKGRELEKAALEHPRITGRTLSKKALLDHIVDNYEETWAQVEKLVEVMEEVAQWDGERTSIIPSKALAHYARRASEALRECGFGGEE